MSEAADRRVRVVEASTFVEGASVRIENRDGWLHVVVEASERIVGYAVTVNGRDLPYEPERAS